MWKKQKRLCQSETHGHIAEIESGRRPVDVSVYTRNNTETEEEKKRQETSACYRIIPLLYYCPSVYRDDPVGIYRCGELTLKMDLKNKFADP